MRILYLFIALIITDIPSNATTKVYTYDSEIVTADNRKHGFLFPHLGHVEEQFLLRLKKIPDESNVAIFGCGEGRMLKKMARKFPKLTFYGLDLSKSQIQKARKGAPRNTQFNVHDVTQKFRCDIKFSLIGMFNVWHFLPCGKMKPALQHLRSYLKDDGQLHMCGLTDGIEAPSWLLPSFAHDHDVDAAFKRYEIYRLIPFFMGILPLDRLQVSPQQWDQLFQNMMKILEKDANFVGKEFYEYPGVEPLYKLLRGQFGETQYVSLYAAHLAIGRAKLNGQVNKDSKEYSDFTRRLFNRAAVRLQEELQVQDPWRVDGRNCPQMKGEGFSLPNLKSLANVFKGVGLEIIDHQYFNQRFYNPRDQEWNYSFIEHGEHGDCINLSVILKPVQPEKVEGVRAVPQMDFYRARKIKALAQHPYAELVETKKSSG
ncbi:MAG: class I SAM-dependent methyltransferase, partial [Alphaproteobacteria bacterium]